MLELKSANLFWTGMLMPILAVGACAKPLSRRPRLSASAPLTPRIHRHAEARHALRMPIECSHRPYIV